MITLNYLHTVLRWSVRGRLSENTNYNIELFLELGSQWFYRIYLQRSHGNHCARSIHWPTSLGSGAMARCTSLQASLAKPSMGNSPPALNCKEPLRQVSTLPSTWLLLEPEHISSLESVNSTFVPSLVAIWSDMDTLLTDKLTPGRTLTISHQWKNFRQPNGVNTK